MPGDEPKHPVFVKFPTSVSVLETESTTFECELDSELLNLVWVKDGKPIDETLSRYSFTKDSNRYCFTVAKCNLDDVGQYQAKAVAKKGESICAFSMNVHYAES